MNSIVAPLVILLLFITYCYYFFTCGELYEGDAIYNISGQLIHEDCLLDFARSYFADCLAEVRV